MLCRCCKVIMHWFGYNGFRSLWDWIVRNKNPLLFFLFPLIPLFRFLTYSKKGGNEPETSDDNGRLLKNSLDDEEAISAGQKRSSDDEDGVPVSKRVKSDQEDFQNDRVETADENVSKEMNIYSNR